MELANYKETGYKSAKEYALAMFGGDEDKMLLAFVNYIKANAKTYKALKDKNWQKFAEYYNGRDYKKNQYD